jgi:hypothetical protein
MVNGMKFPYSEKGKKAAKKAAVAMKTGSKKAKKAFSGANSQMGSSY